MLDFYPQEKLIILINFFIIKFEKKSLNLIINNVIKIYILIFNILF